MFRVNGLRTGRSLIKRCNVNDDNTANCMDETATNQILNSHEKQVFSPIQGKSPARIEQGVRFAWKNPNAVSRCRVMFPNTKNFCTFPMAHIHTSQD